MDRDRGGLLHTHLRQQKRPKRISSKTAYRGSIPHRVSIDDRPALVEEKTRIGDGEVDLMMGGHGGGGRLTLVDRKIRFTRIQPVLSKHADHIAATNLPNTKESPRPYRPKCILPIRIVPGSADLTKTPMDYFASIYPRALTLRGSLKPTFDQQKTDLMIDLGNHWNFDHQTISFNTVNRKH